MMEPPGGAYALNILLRGRGGGVLGLGEEPGDLHQEALEG